MAFLGADLFHELVLIRRGCSRIASARRRRRGVRRRRRRSGRRGARRRWRLTRGVRHALELLEQLLYFGVGDEGFRLDREPESLRHVSVGQGAPGYCEALETLVFIRG